MMLNQTLVRQLMDGVAPAYWILSGLILFLATLVMISMCINRPSKKKRPPKENQMAKAVAESLAEPVPGEAQGKLYSYDDYIRDIISGDVPLSEILERCGGIIPRKPKDSPEIVSAKPQDPGYTDRLNERMKWFEELARKQPKLKMTAPPVPTPVLLVKGQMVRCTCSCHGHGADYKSLPVSYGFGSGFGGRIQPPGSACYPKCHACKGTGFVIIT